MCDCWPILIRFINLAFIWTHLFVGDYIVFLTSLFLQFIQYFVLQMRCMFWKLIFSWLCFVLFLSVSSQRCPVNKLNSAGSLINNWQMITSCVQKASCFFVENIFICEFPSVNKHNALGHGNVARAPCMTNQGKPLLGQGVRWLWARPHELRGTVQSQTSLFCSTFTRKAQGDDEKEDRDDDKMATTRTTRW